MCFKTSNAKEILGEKLGPQNMNKENKHGKWSLTYQDKLQLQEQ